MPPGGGGSMRPAELVRSMGRMLALWPTTSRFKLLPRLRWLSSSDMPVNDSDSDSSPTSFSNRLFGRGPHEPVAEPCMVPVPGARIGGCAADGCWVLARAGSCGSSDMLRPRPSPSSESECPKLHCRPALSIFPAASEDRNRSSWSAMTPVMTFCARSTPPPDATPLFTPARYARCISAFSRALSVTSSNSLDLSSSCLP
mmetsp:Transcript_31870/g.65654  ORF Transcript_31870/g.65654 Transcript_31870/m.65654 type:complete len:200 (-) Transcript_31870:112-711(-)